MSTDTGGWGAPAGIMNFCTGEMEYGGLIWYGEEFPTKEDFQNLLDNFGEAFMLDVPTLFGKPSHRDRVKDLPCYQAPTVKL